MSLSPFVPSGALSKPGLIKFAGLSFALALIAGIFFGAFCRFNPLVYIPIGIMGMHVSTIGVLAAWVGTLFFVVWGLGKITRATKLQNPLVVGLAGVGIGIISYFFHWCTLSSLTVMEVVVLPQDVLSFMGALVENDYMSFGLIESPRTNWFFWGIEAIGFALAGYIGPSSEAATPFCSECDDWADSPAGGIDVPLALGEEQAKQLIESQDFSQLSAAVTNENGQLYRLSMCGCDKCKTKSFLSLSKLNYEVDEDGDVTEKVEGLSEHLMVNPQQIADLGHAFKERLSLEGDTPLFGFSASA